MKDNNIEYQEITPELKTLLMKNYFFVNKAKFPSFFAGSALMSYIFIAISLFVVVYFEHVFWTYLFAVILVSVAFLYTFRWVTPYFVQKRKFSKRPTTDQMENWLIRDIRDTVKPMATEMLSLNPATITPENFIVVPYPVFWETPNVPPENIAIYNAGDYNVFATYKIQVIALSDNYVSFYNCVYNWLDNAVAAPNTLEFFFDDISSITAIDQKLDFRKINAPAVAEDEKDSPDNFVGIAQTVVVRNKSGEEMNIIVNIPSLTSSPRSTLKSEKVMQTLRLMLRHRRYGEEFEIIRPTEDEATPPEP